MTRTGGVFRPHKIIGGALAGVVAAATVVALAPVAHAVPALESPFVCGTSWDGNSGGSSAHHNYEIDFNKTGTSGDGDLGQPVVAAAAGTVTDEGGASSDYGNFLEIDHGGGYSTLYAHLDSKAVHAGDTVRQGELIATVGNTDGNSSGISAHLHFEYRNRGSGQGYPDYIRPASFHGDPFDYATGRETYVSQNCGTSVTSFPGLSVTSRGLGGLDVFATTTDGLLKHRNLSNSTWSCWVTLAQNARIKGDPAAIASQDRIDVFALGVDNRLKKITWLRNVGWSPWADMGESTLTSSPAVTSRGATGIDVFVRNNGNKIVYRHFDTARNAWTTAWGYIGLNWSTTSSSSGPAAVAHADGARMTVLARDEDGSLLSLLWTRDSGWFSWIDRGGAGTGRPAASTRGGTGFDVFLRDQDDSLIHRYTPDGVDWTTYGPVDLGGHIYTSPTSTSMSNQRIDVFTRNVDADLVTRIWSVSNNGWYPWVGLGPVGAPACS